MAKKCFMARAIVESLFIAEENDSDLLQDEAHDAICAQLRFSSLGDYIQEPVIATYIPVDWDLDRDCPFGDNEEELTARQALELNKNE